MAKQAKLLPARRQRDEPQDVDSILFRSAESIGRLIGTLQRQLDSARDQIARFSHNGNGESLTDQKVQRKRRSAAPKTKASASVPRAGTTRRKKPTKPTAASRSTRAAEPGRRKNLTPRAAKAKRARKSR